MPATILSRLPNRGQPGAERLQSDVASEGTDSGIDRPNIIIVVTDDMRDSDWQALPQIRERVGGAGTTFPNFFLTTPACSPSRTSILTGQYAHNHGVQRSKGENGGFAKFKQRNLGQQSISAALKAVGYRTGLFGKFLNGTPEKGSIPGGWDQWMATSELSYYRPQMNDNGKERDFQKKRQYSTDILRGRALQFIGSTPAEPPLFLYFAPKAPHDPATPARRDRGAFAGVRRERSPDFNEADVSDKPGYVRRLTGPNSGKMDALEQRRLESLLATDAAVAELLDAMQDAGRLANTYVFVVSDNGHAMGSHRLDGKDAPYDEATRVSLVASGPRLAGGGVDPRIAANIDIASTIADVAGLSFETGDGLSLAGDETREAILLESWLLGFFAVRTAQYLYVENGGNERELYDYQNDPYELDNLIADWNGHEPAPGAEAIAADLKAMLDDLRPCAGNACR